MIEREHILYLEHVGLVGFGAEELELQMLFFANVSSLGERLVIRFSLGCKGQGLELWFRLCGLGGQADSAAGLQVGSQAANIEGFGFRV